MTRWFWSIRGAPPTQGSDIQFRVNRPAGVSAIAILFLAAAGYLSVLGLIMLKAPGLVSMALGAPLLLGLEVAGPYMFLLPAIAAGLIGWGLLRLNRWARHVAALTAIFGAVLLIPRVSGDVIAMQFGNLAWSALQLIVRVIVAWYLYQEPVIAAFEQIAYPPRIT
jgi:hypothetical protein